MTSSLSPQGVLHIPASRKSGKRVLVFFIVGNPGTVEFYSSFLQLLSFQLNDVDPESGVSYDIYCPGLLGHHLKDSIPADEYKSYSLNQQIQYLEETITSILKSSDWNVEIAFIGHSIGAYAVLEMLSKNVKIKKHTSHASLLMPFIFWDNLPYLHRMKLNILVLNSPLQSIITAVVQSMRFIAFDIVPTSVLNWIVRSFLLSRKQITYEYDKIAEILCNKLFTYRLVNNFLHMGSDEIRQVPLNQKRMLSILQKIDCDNKHIYHSHSQHVNLHLVYTDNDEWAPSQDITMLKSTFSLNHNNNCTQPQKQPRITYMEGIGHTFTMKYDGTMKVCEELVLAITGVKSVVSNINNKEDVNHLNDDSDSINSSKSDRSFIVLLTVLACFGIEFVYRLK